MWQQTYLLFGQSLALSFALASLPIVTLLVLIAVFRRPAWLAGLAGLAVALALAVLGYGMPAAMAVSSATYGVAFGFFPILWIIFWAIVLFRITVETGQFEIIKNSIGRLTPDPRLQAVLIAFSFSGFLEGSAGFGTPVAIASTMLIGLGFSPFTAAAFCLLANTAPVAFGSIGIPVFTLAGTTGLSPFRLSAAVGALCAPVSFLIPLYMVLAVGGRKATRGIWVPLLLAGSVCGSVQFLVATYLGPALTDIFAGVASMASVILYLRFSPAHPALSVETQAVILGHPSSGMSTPHSQQDEATSVREPVAIYPWRTVLFAWLPYALLVACVLLWGWPPLAAFLNRFSIQIAWPHLHNAAVKMPPVVPQSAPYAAVFTLNLLSAAGTALMLAAVLSAALLRTNVPRFLRILQDVVRQLARPAATISVVLAMAFLMNYSGATGTLGLAFAATGVLFPFFSAMLGWLGVFLTGSDTSANALFGSLQVVTANHLGFNPVLMAAGNSAGGVMGKMMSLQTIAIAAGATGLSSLEQTRLFRFTLKHSVTLAALTGLLVLLYAHLRHFR